jgi:hypothetical protein
MRSFLLRDMGPAVESGPITFYTFLKRVKVGKRLA